MSRQRKQKLKQRADGRYRCRYKGIEFYSTVSSDDALAQREEYKRMERTGTVGRMTVSDYALPWLKRSFPKVTDSTYTGLAIHLQHLVDEIGNKQISAVVASDLKAVYSAHYANLSNSYILSAKQLFSSLFDSAQADGLISHNPARTKAGTPHKGNKPKQRILSKQQRYWIETLCTDHRAYPVVMAMLYAGLRPQEAKAILIERDIDFDREVITIHQTAHNNGQGYDYTEQGKTELANRTIPLFPPLKSVLAGKTGYLITSAHGEQVTHTTWRVAWNSYVTCMETAINGISKRWYGKTKEQQALKQAGLLPPWIDFDVVPYTLRHAFCEMCRSAGVEINTCRLWMGHADSKMILKVYDSVSEDRSDRERKKVDSGLFWGQNGGQSEQGTTGNVDG